MNGGMYVQRLQDEPALQNEPYLYIVCPDECAFTWVHYLCIMVLHALGKSSGHDQHDNNAFILSFPPLNENAS